MRRRGARGMVFCLGLLFLALNPVYAQEEKLGPGLLSLDSSVGVLDQKIQEGKSNLENALGVNISGFLDTSYTWSSNRPGSAFDRDISGRYFDQDHNDIVFNAFNLTVERPEPEEGWGVGFKAVGDFGRSGELLREATFYGKSKFKDAGNGGEPSAELREAFLTTTVPVGAGINVKGGLFVTLLGTEILPNPGAYNDNISRSFLFNLAIPFRHLGILFSYPVHEMVSITAGPVTGWDNPHDSNKQPSFLGGVNFTPSDFFALASNVVAGAEQGANSGHYRVAWSNVATIKPMDPLTIYLEYTYGNEGSLGGHWQGGAAIFSYNWTDRFNTAFRGEIFHDEGGSRTGVPKVDLGEVTLTAAYKFTEKLLGRFEVRPDWADKKVFAKGSSSFDKNQTTLALQAIYTF